MNAKRKAVLDRIKDFEKSIAIAREYLESGKHTDWQGFRPFFVAKRRNGKLMPPHKDWVKNVLLPDYERRLKKSERALERLR